jgi:hypothetical protein
MEIQQALSTWKLGSSVEPAPIPQKWVARIFERLQAQLGTKVADLYAGVPSETVQEEWGRALADFHPAEIDRGLKACATRVFAPTLGEFCHALPPSTRSRGGLHRSGATVISPARPRACTGDWSHPAVYRAATQMGHEVRMGRKLTAKCAGGGSGLLRCGVHARLVGESRSRARPSSTNPKRTPAHRRRAQKKLQEYRNLIAAGFS